VYLFWVRSGTLVAQELDPRTPQLIGEPQPISEALKTSTGTEMHAASSGTGLLMYGAFGDMTQFAWFDRQGRKIHEVGEPLDLEGNVYMFRLSTDGRQIAVQRGPVFWMMDSARGLPSRFTTGATSSTHPIWSPDSRTVLFSHLGSGDLARKAANGVGDEQVVGRRPNMTLLYDWSRDGRLALTGELTSDSKSGIWLLPITPDGELRQGDVPKPYVHTNFHGFHARFSPEPNPKRVAYVSDDSGRPEVYIDAFPEPRGKKQVSARGGNFPQWGVGSGELFYVSPEHRLMAVSLNLGSDSIVPSPPRELFQLPALNGPADSPYEAARDGQRFLVRTSTEQLPRSLTLIVNWPALLKKETAAQ
jgi:hypothetical protein